MSKRRQYSPEFKREAVELTMTTGVYGELIFRWQQVADITHDNEIPDGIVQGQRDGWFRSAELRWRGIPWVEMAVLNMRHNAIPSTSPVCTANPMMRRVN